MTFCCVLRVAALCSLQVLLAFLDLINQATYSVIISLFLMKLSRFWYLVVKQMSIKNVSLFIYLKHVLITVKSLFQTDILKQSTSAHPAVNQYLDLGLKRIPVTVFGTEIFLTPDVEKCTSIRFTIFTAYIQAA